MGTEFLADLKAHLLGRLLDIPYGGDKTQFSLQDIANVASGSTSIPTKYSVSIARPTRLNGIKIHLDTSVHLDFMEFSREEENNNLHPYCWTPLQKGGQLQRMEFLWVRWFGLDIDHVAGWATKRLNRIGFVDADNAFHHGRTAELLGPSIARHFDGNNDEDYRYYYMNSFVDRDMFMSNSPDAVGRRSAQPTVFTPPVDPDAVEQWVDADEDEDDQFPADPELDDGERGPDSEEEEEGRVLDSESEDLDAEEEDGEEDDVEENAADGGTEATDEGITEFLDSFERTIPIPAPFRPQTASVLDGHLNYKDFFNAIMELFTDPDGAEWAKEPLACLWSAPRPVKNATAAIKAQLAKRAAATSIYCFNNNTIMLVEDPSALIRLPEFIGDLLHTSHPDRLRVRPSCPIALTFSKLKFLLLNGMNSRSTCIVAHRVLAELEVSPFYRF
ncbi:hypothetical protein B0H16DRAFT_1901071 [Mycena metata]|uniref:Uncharacterized protein n=1 Tax=Mycena metata TaxID=1033252 RepID=A0AAD7H0L6_9AGAR|nr:hypothetical protein B0H16DRAFT_1901071 [Mycena metata]